jgi:hypothetical protein
MKKNLTANLADPRSMYRFPPNSLERLISEDRSVGGNDLSSPNLAQK